jgi:hypothetical protein
VKTSKLLLSDMGCSQASPWTNPGDSNNPRYVGSPCLPLADSSRQCIIGRCQLRLQEDARDPVTEATRRGVHGSQRSVGLATSSVPIARISVPLYSSGTTRPGKDQQLSLSIKGAAPSTSRWTNSLRMASLSSLVGKRAPREIRRVRIDMMGSSKKR